MARERIGVLFMQSQSFFGADTFVHSLLMRELDRSRFEVHVACTSESSGPGRSVMYRLRDIPDLTIRPTNFGPTVFNQKKSRILRSLGSAVPGVVGLGGLAAYIRRNDIKIIHTTEKPRDALYGVALAKLTRTRSVVQMHVMFHEQISRKVRWALTNATALVGISDFVTRSIVARGIPRARVHTVLNSIDVDAWNPDRDGADLRKALNIEPDAIVITLAARIFKWKGHRELLIALGPVFKQFPSARLVIVGEDDRRAHPGGTSFTEELKQLAGELGIFGQVSFAGFQEDMEAVLAMTDIFAMPSFEEPFGLVFLEAMAMRRPVVALRSGGAPEVIEHGKTGLLSDPGDERMLTENLLRLVASPEERGAMGSRGRILARSSFQPARMARDLERAYTEILGASPASALSEELGTGPAR